VLGRLQLLKRFLKYCARALNLPAAQIALEQIDWKEIGAAWPSTYGRVQAITPGRWLSREEAQLLIGACQDGTWIGSRDQLVIRLGLLGMRRAEIVALDWRHWRPGDQCIEIVGKKNRPRSIPLGPHMTDLLERWYRHYARELGRPINPTDPIIPAVRMTAPPTPIRHLSFEIRVSTAAVHQIVVTRAHAAGLGHVSTHDLRRSAASILHAERTPEGGHAYDLADIQAMLDHASPDTTQRAYLGPVTRREAKARAALALD
jgi:integrase/recombinase XerD